MEMTALAPIEVEILLLFPLKSKRLKRIAGLAPKKIWFYHRIEMTNFPRILNITNPTGFKNLSGLNNYTKKSSNKNWSFSNMKTVN